MKCAALSLSLTSFLLWSMAAANLYDDLMAKLGTEPLPAMFQYKDGESVCEWKEETKFSKLGLIPSGASAVAVRKDIGDIAGLLAPNLAQRAAEVQKLNRENNVADATKLSQKIDPDITMLKDCIQAMFNAICHKATTIGTPGKIKTVDDVIMRVKDKLVEFKIPKWCHVTLKNPLSTSGFGLFGFLRINF